MEDSCRNGLGIFIGIVAIVISLLVHFWDDIDLIDEYECTYEVYQNGIKIDTVTEIKTSNCKKRGCNGDYCRLIKKVKLDGDRSPTTEQLKQMELEEMKSKEEVRKMLRKTKKY